MTHAFPVPAVSDAIRSQLAPTGYLRAGINLSNTLLVSGRTKEGAPEGVSPDMARAVAAALSVPCQLVPYPTPGEVADAIARDEWDIGLIGAEPQRAAIIAFSPAYAEIEACYCVRADSNLTNHSDIDQPGRRIATTARAAFTLWLERNIHQATLIPAESLDAARDCFLRGEAHVLASLRTKIEDAKMPGTRLIEPAFMTVQQAIGCAKAHIEAAEWLAALVRSACESGFVAARIQHHEVRGLQAARP